MTDGAGTATRAGTKKRRGEAIEVTVVCVATLVLLAVVLVLGMWGSSSACYSGHPGEPVRWTFTDGCELNIAGTWMPVASVHQPGTG